MENLDVDKLLKAGAPPIPDRRAMPGYMGAMGALGGNFMMGPPPAGGAAFGVSTYVL